MNTLIFADRSFNDISTLTDYFSNNKYTEDRFYLMCQSDFVKQYFNGEGYRQDHIIDFSDKECDIDKINKVFVFKALKDSTTDYVQYKTQLEDVPIKTVISSIKPYIDHGKKKGKKSSQKAVSSMGLQNFREKNANDAYKKMLDRRKKKKNTKKNTKKKKVSNKKQETCKQ